MERGFYLQANGHGAMLCKSMMSDNIADTEKESAISVFRQIIEHIKNANVNIVIQHISLFSETNHIILYYFKKKRTGISPLELVEKKYTSLKELNQCISKDFSNL